MGRGKRILAASLTAVMLTSSFGVTVFAEGEEDAAQITQGDMAAENSEKTEEEIAAEEAAAKQASYDTPADSNSLENWPTGPNVFAASAIVMDMDSGAVLYSKRADEEHYPASITKLLTVLVALENAELTDKVTFTEDCVNFLNWDDANIGMKAGEEITLEDALYGVLLASANEVSYAVAKNVGESMGVGYDGFIEEMNERAQQLGCTDSHWVNANGLHDGQHYTTAHDMAVIASAVYQQDEFCKIEQSLDYTIGKTNITDEERVFQQNHKMLWPENYYYYPHAKAGKTGYTDQAKTTLVTMADNGTLRLAAVVLGDYGVDAYTDTQSMLDYTFSNFQKIFLKDVETSEAIESFVDKDAYILMPGGIDFSDIDRKIVENTDNADTELRNAKAVYTYRGQVVGSAEVKLSDSYRKAQEKENGSDTDLSGKESDGSNNKNTSLKKLAPVVIGATVFVILLIFLVRWIFEMKRRKARRRREVRQKRGRHS